MGVTNGPTMQLKVAIKKHCIHAGMILYIVNANYVLRKPLQLEAFVFYRSVYFKKKIFLLNTKVLFVYRLYFQ